MRIEDALRGGDRVLQSQLVLQSAELLTKRWSRLPPAQKPAFDALLVALCGQIDAEARTAFAERLADLRLGPPRTGEALARDGSIRVAVPLLTRCSSLGTDLLAEMATSAGEGQRLAIAARPTVPAVVTDPLVHCGSSRVAARLLDNPGARFSEAGISGLMAHSTATEAVTLRLALHPDLPPARLPELLALTRGRAIDALHRDLGSDGALAGRLLSQAAETLARPVAAERIARFEASTDFIRRRFAASTPRPALLERWASLKRIEDALAAIAHCTGLHLGQTVAAFDATAPATLVALMRGLDHPWSVLKALLTERHGGSVPVATMQESYDLHRRLEPLAARRLIRFAALPLRCAAFPDEADEPDPFKPAHFA